MKILRIKNNNLGVGERLDVFIASCYQGYSRALISKLITEGMVIVNGKPANKKYKVKPDDKICVKEEFLKPSIPQIDLPILYEDKNVIVIDKPTGVLTHPNSEVTNEPSVASFINRGRGKQGPRNGIVHRLDRGTSGIIITAKNKQTLMFLQKQFANRDVAKEYIAIVKGTPVSEEGLIDAPIARNARKPYTFLVSHEGKKAITQYKITKTAKGYSRIILYPKTGRTHQLRVHMSELGFPIVGDVLYGGETASRVMLHATSLSLKLPEGCQKVFNSKTPREFQNYVR